MALPGISIDDRSYADLLDLMRRQIDGEAWSDHNPSDPGIMLLELLTWLGEMALYRMDRIPASRREAFLNLVIDPPEPATVMVTFELQQPAASGGAASPELRVPAGTRLATPFRDIDGRSERIVYETLTDAVFQRPDSPGSSALRSRVTARELTLVENQVLGQSDGSARQIFDLIPPRTRLGLAPDEPAPVLLDMVHASAGYDPNPVISVAGTPWTAVRALQTDAGRVDPMTPGSAQMVMIDPVRNRALFGDGTYGTVPPPGAEIRAERYRILRGPRSFVRAGDLVFIVDTVGGLEPGENLALGNTDEAAPGNTDALGGTGFFPPDQREAQGLQSFARRYRMVTEDDFVGVVADDLNPYLTALGTADQVRRSTVLMNRRLPLSDMAHAPGHVTLMLLTEIPDQIAAAGGGTTPLADFLGQSGTGAPTLIQKQDAIALPQPLETRFRRFLDQHRLITTQLHLAVPTLVGLSLDMDVVLHPDESRDQRLAEIETRLKDWFDALTGGPDGTGWPLGQSVHPSQVYALVEGTPGVDHVATLTLGPTPGVDGAVPIAPDELPVLDVLTLRSGAP